MLIKAKLYKYLHIKHNTVTLFPQILDTDSVEISVKCDNFVNQLDIKWNVEGVGTPFDYKYITFDNYTLFEITDVIKNGDIYTLFLLYVTNIDLNGNVDNNFKITALSPRDYHSAHFSRPELMNILQDLYTEKRTPQLNQNFIWAVKLRMSEIPQNLSYALSDSGSYIAGAGTTRLDLGNRILTTFEDVPRQVRQNDFTGFDNAITLIVPIPQNDTQLNINVINGTKTIPLFLRKTGFTKALNDLITDLCLSVEIIPIASNSLYTIDLSLNYTPIVVNNNGSVTTVQIKYPAGMSISDSANIRSLVAGNASTPTTDVYPIILCENKANTGGIWEAHYPIKIGYNLNSQNVPVAINFLQSTLPVEDVLDLAIMTQAQGVRFYTNYTKNIFYDLSTSVEYAKSAYSNYEAYKKSNIELENRQYSEQLKLQQQQRRDMLGFEQAQNVIGGVAGSIGALAQGHWGEAAAQAAGAIGGAILSGIKDDKTIENENANAALRKSQQLQAARQTIQPASDIKGSVFLSALLSNDTNALQFFISFLETNSLTTTWLKRYLLKNKVVNNIISTFTNIPIIFDREYCIRISPQNPLNNRKEAILYGVLE